MKFDFTRFCLIEFAGFSVEPERVPVFRSLQKSVFKVNENCVDFLIRKQKSEIWPRLTLNKLRRAWLKVNFEKSQWNEIEDEQEPFSKAKNEELDFYLRNDVSKIGDRTLFQKPELLEPTAEDLRRRPISNVEFMRKFYLSLYNLIQIYGSVYLVTGLLLRYDGSNSSLTACRDMQSTINFLCFIKLFEIPHQTFGFVFRKDRTVWHTVLNRLFIFCVLIEFEPRLLVKPVVFYLVLLYATFDLVSYVHYTLRVLELDVQAFKWLKCTVWIPIYPLIFLCEAVILLRSIPYYGETKRLTLELPNALNVSFSFLHVLRIYLFFIFTPSKRIATGFSRQLTGCPENLLIE